MKWVLVVWLGGGLYLPVLAYDTEEECWNSVQAVEAGVQYTCVQGKIEQPKRAKSRRRRR